MLKIESGKIKDCTVTVPGSKSFTHRILIASALADGISTISNALKCKDTIITVNALKSMGVKIKGKWDKMTVFGRGGNFSACQKPISLENSGTSMRLIIPLASLGKKNYTFTCLPGSQRPIKDLTDALNFLNIKTDYLEKEGFLPLKIEAGKTAVSKVDLKCDISSQPLSGLMLLAPYTENGLDITVTKGPVSRPYIDMTVDIMIKAGVRIQREAYSRFYIKGGQTFKPINYRVEPDISNASYFWAIAAINRVKVKVLGIDKNTVQGDIRFLDILKQMGCDIIYENDGIAVRGRELKSVEVDMADTPDIVPSLAVVAAFAKGTSVIKNISHIKTKESDRIKAVISQINNMGAHAITDYDSIIIHGGKKLHPAVIDTFDDHRIAMSFAAAATRVPATVIDNERCVEKSFPNFWEIFSNL